VQKNVTITLDESVLRWVRRQAAEHDMSVSRWVGDVLAQQMRQALDQRQTLTDILELLEQVPAGTGYGKRVARDSAHDRRP